MFRNVKKLAEGGTRALEGMLSPYLLVAATNRAGRTCFDFCLHLQSAWLAPPLRPVCRLAFTIGVEFLIAVLARARRDFAAETVIL